MRRKSDAQIYLEQAEMLEAIIKNKMIERKQWRELALNITANMDGERVQSSGARSKMADAVDKCVDMEAEIDALVDRLIETKKDIVQTIEMLYSPVEYDVLHMKYIQFKDFYEIAEKYKKDYGWATTTHGRALTHVQEILDRK